MACKPQGNLSLHVIPISTILVVVGMIPLPQGATNECGQFYFVAEKIGLDTCTLRSGYDLFSDDEDSE